MRGIAYGPGSTSNLFAILISTRGRGGGGGEVNYQRILNSKNDVAALLQMPLKRSSRFQGASWRNNRVNLVGI